MVTRVKHPKLGKSSGRSDWSFKESENHYPNKSPVLRNPKRKHPNKKTKAERRRQKKWDKLKKAGIGDNFYESDEWRRLRYRVLKNNHGCCMLCGKSYRKHRVTLHVDHIKPKSKRPDLALDYNNLQILCEACNLGKMNLDDTDWRPEADKNNEAELEIVAEALTRI